VEVVASLSQGRTAAVQCGLFTHKSVPSYLNHLVFLLGDSPASEFYVPTFRNNVSVPSS